MGQAIRSRLPDPQWEYLCNWALFVSTGQLGQKRLTSPPIELHLHSDGSPDISVTFRLSPPYLTLAALRKSCMPRSLQSVGRSEILSTKYASSCSGAHPRVSSLP